MAPVAFTGTGSFRVFSRSEVAERDSDSTHSIRCVPLLPKLATAATLPPSSSRSRRMRSPSSASTCSNYSAIQARLSKIDEDELKRVPSLQVAQSIGTPENLERTSSVREKQWQSMHWKTSEETLSEPQLTQEELLITQFFNVKVPLALAKRGYTGGTITPKQCIDLAARIMEPFEIRLMSNQGSNSYTLVCPSTAKIIQFRLQEPNISILNLARSIYGKLVPEIAFYPHFALPTYILDFLPGNPHILLPFPVGHFPLARERSTITGLAAFIAKATHFPQAVESCSPDSWTLTARDRLTRLRANEKLQEVDLRFQKKADELLDKLHLLDLLPPVLTHHDFAQINVLVADDGRVTGVIDLDAAGIEAFGMCIFGIYECFLGNMVDGAWTFYNQQAPGCPNQTVREVLERTFWDTLWATMDKELGGRRNEVEEALQVAVDIGIINRYFVEGMLDRIDLKRAIHRMSLEYARGILLGR